MKTENYVVIYLCKVKVKFKCIDKSGFMCIIYISKRVFTVFLPKISMLKTNQLMKKHRKMSEKKACCQLTFRENDVSLFKLGKEIFDFFSRLFSSYLFTEFVFS